MIVNGVDFGIYTIAEEDWSFISAICKREGYKSVLEFGAGASTVLFADLYLNVYSVETDPAYAKKVIQLNLPNVCVALQIPNSTLPIYSADLVFVDGPFVSKERDANIRLAGCMEGVKGVILHDSHEPWILEYGVEYLVKNGFTQLEFGGSVYKAEPPGSAPYEGRYRCTHWSRP